jgi:hypothetical protein
MRIVASVISLFSHGIVFVIIPDKLDHIGEIWQRCRIVPPIELDT